MQDGDIDTELKAGLSNSPFTKRGSGTGSRSGSIAPILVSGPPEPGGAEGDEGTVAMADDDYSARQLTWQSQSNENMKLLLSRFTPEQLLARYETYRRSTPNKQTARRVVAGFSKVFVGDIIELGSYTKSSLSPSNFLLISSARHVQE
ncbi:hypothetical protein FRC09_002187 [Ceratobasidium sp. 395]|nr:hypothetical protein FRC09_002187 [Ceratobasidium sp. 395]